MEKKPARKRRRPGKLTVRSSFSDTPITEAAFDEWVRNYVGILMSLDEEDLKKKLAGKRGTPNTVRETQSTGGELEANELVRRRERLGMSRTELANALGITPRAIRYYETGERPISQTIELALRYLEIEARLANNLKRRS
jgi:DNA-binding transcriptional regulator YiaG